MRTLPAVMAAGAPLIIRVCEIATVLTVVGIFALMIGMFVWSRASKGAPNNEFSPMTSRDVAAAWIFGALTVILGAFLGVCLGVAYQLHYESPVMLIALLVLFMGIVIYGLFSIVMVIRHRLNSPAKYPHAE